MANGLSDQQLDYATFRACVKKNEFTIEKALALVLAEIVPSVVHHAAPATATLVAAAAAATAAVAVDGGAASGVAQ
jgi:hypothetical protein